MAPGFMWLSCGGVAFLAMVPGLFFHSIFQPPKLSSFTLPISALYSASHVLNLLN